MLMKKEKLAQLLRSLADSIESGDSLEGSVRYTIPRDPKIEELHVFGAVRTGNLEGQGGVTLLGEEEESPYEVAD